MRDRKSDAHTRVLKVASNEVRHHKDENKENNSKDNLEPVDRGKHTAAHNRARGLSRLRKALAMQQRGEKLY